MMAGKSVRKGDLEASLGFLDKFMVKQIAQTDSGLCERQT
jgi:hypothetical protein